MHAAYLFIFISDHRGQQDQWTVFKSLSPWAGVQWGPTGVYSSVLHREEVVWPV